MKTYPKINGKVVGEYDTDKHLFTKNVKRNKHRMWKYNAYGIQMNIYEGLLKRDCKSIVIKEKDTGDMYYSTIDQWGKQGVVEDNGYGTQVFLPVTDMNQINT